MYMAISFGFLLVLMMTVGLFAARRGKTDPDAYLTGGRGHSKLFIAFSSAASANSGFIMIGAVGAGYNMGLFALLMPLGWMLGDLVFWKLFPAKINARARETNCNTIPEFIGHSCEGDSCDGGRSSGLRAFLAVIAIVFIGLYAVGQFMAAGKAMDGAFGINPSTGIIISTLIILIYSAKGGLQSSIPTQFVQGVLMVGTILGVFSLALWLGGGPQNIFTVLQAKHPGLLQLDGGRGLLLAGIFLLGFATTAFTFNIGQPHILIRIMAAKTPVEAAGVRWIYIAFIQITWGAMTLFGLMMVVLMPDISDPELALPSFARINLHPILAGAVLAGVFAAIASTLDALLLVLSSSLGVDLFPRFYAKMNDRFGPFYQVFSTVLVTLLTVVTALFLIDSSSVLAVMFFGASGAGVGIGIAMLISVQQWKTSPTAIIISSACGVSAAAVWRFSGYSDVLLESVAGLFTAILIHTLYSKIALNHQPQTTL